MDYYHYYRNIIISSITEYIKYIKNTKINIYYLLSLIIIIVPITYCGLQLYLNGYSVIYGGYRNKQIFKATIANITRCHYNDYICSIGHFNVLVTYNSTIYNLTKYYRLNGYGHSHMSIFKNNFKINATVDVLIDRTKNPIFATIEFADEIAKFGFMVLIISAIIYITIILSVIKYEYDTRNYNFHNTINKSQIENKYKIKKQKIIKYISDFMKDNYSEIQLCSSAIERKIKNEEKQALLSFYHSIKNYENENENENENKFYSKLYDSNCSICITEICKSDIVFLCCGQENIVFLTKKQRFLSYLS